MDYSTLAALEHKNWIAYLAVSAALHPSGLVIRDHDIVAVLGHVPMRFFNQVLVEGQQASAGAIRSAVATGRRRHDPFAVSLREGLDDRFVPLMAELGLVATVDAATHAMALYPLLPAAGAAEVETGGFEIRRVGDESALADHRQAVTEGFAADPSVADAMMGAELLNRSECAVYVGYLEGIPVASGMGWRTGRTIGVYNIATVPTARRRGFGEAMTRRVLADGVAAGCDVATLQASPVGRPIYERVGFRTAVRYAGYTDPPRIAG